MMIRFRSGVALLVVGVALFVGGWSFGSRDGRETLPITSAPSADRDLVQELKQSIITKDRRLADLHGDLSSARRELAEQRQILREHALTKTVRSVDEMLALFPAKYPEGDWSPAETGFEDCWFEAVDGVRLHGWYLRPDTPSAVILYAHGNAGNVTHRAAVGVRLAKQFNASVLLFDYRGYGRSEGTPTVDGLIRDARAARDYLALREQVLAQDIVLMGRSLGGAIAVELAAEDGARALVLESTFSSLRDVAVRHYPKLLVNVLVADRLNSGSTIARYHDPVLISHGDSDRTIPFTLGQQLFAAANQPKTFVPLTDRDHNDWQGDDYYNQLARFLERLPSQTAD